ncbi:tRNA (adenosine(37)-N6)-threonylcarbamoyltransferase complex ATPase subunit type 1 TsaE [Planctomycetota bacterium]|nr:tRNA (adenosine(37)-N6)-threonylcarbamoyltransferase complex ATPase subunit type 1 TsaE [Planctomycetota bacterium]
MTEHTTKTFITDVVDQTVAVGTAVGKLAREFDVIALVGDLGAGKTQFVRGLATGMNLYPQAVSSPTFVVMQEYDTEEGAELVLVHIDAYRLESIDDLASIGWTGNGDEIRTGAVVAIEWANMIDWALDADTLLVDIAHAENGRKITLTAGSAWQDRLKSIAPITSK